MFACMHSKLTNERYAGYKASTPDGRHPLRFGRLNGRKLAQFPTIQLPLFYRLVKNVTTQKYVVPRGHSLPLLASLGNLCEKK
jgi:hypothetical protein